MKKVFSLIVLIIICFNLMMIVPQLKQNYIPGDLETSIQKSFFKRDELFDIYGLVTLIISPNEILDNNSQTVRLTDGRIVLPRSETNLKYQKEQLSFLAEHCIDNNIDFLYVNLPSQSGGDNELWAVGVPSWCDANANELLSYLTEEKINCLDLKEKFPSGIENGYFYYTDHHWTTLAGFEAAKEILDYCNYSLGYDFDLSLLSSDRYCYTKYNECWLGETGKKVSGTWAKVLDDFTFIEPKFETDVSYVVDSATINRRGEFSDCFIDKSVLEEAKNYYNAKSWHYSYLFSNYDYCELTNNYNVDGKNILLIKDSYSLVMAPFMLMPAKKIVMWDMRFNDNSIEEYINNNDIDIVIVAYTEGSSISKQNMFAFD